MFVQMRASFSVLKCGAVIIVSFFLFGAVAADAAVKADTKNIYYGDYRVDKDHVIGIDGFINDAGDNVILMSDYKTGVVRQLFPVSDAEFVMGPGFDQRTPEELRINFVQDESNGVATSIRIHSAEGVTSSAKRIPDTVENIVINNGQVKLAGTLIVPNTKGPHPAIVLLHGSGPLTRHSFGPYPRFFASLGMEVLIFDKRGTGESTGVRVDASTSISTASQMPDSYYPVDLVSDALAAFRFLQSRPEVDRKEIGFWGSSEGGMLAMQVAAQNREVAFAINSSGFMGPLWKTILHQSIEYAKSRGSSPVEVEEMRKMTELWLRVARTGRGYDLFAHKRAETLEAKKEWLLSYYSSQYSSVEQMRWDWNHILSFNSLDGLGTIHCPTLGVFGQLDKLTDASVAAKRMTEALLQSGNKDVTTHVFPNAGHSLASMPSGDRMAPGVFDTLRSWLQARLPMLGLSQDNEVSK